MHAGARGADAMTEAEATFDELVARVIGRRVTSTRMFLFTLQMYFASEGPDEDVLAIWCEPSWHIRTPSGVVTGSGAIDTPSTYSDDVEVQRASNTITEVANASKILLGRTLESLEVEPLTQALTATFSGGVAAVTFRDDPDGTLWVLRDHARDVAVRGSAGGVRTGTRDAED